MAQRDHKVEMWTSNGDKVTVQATAEEARRLEDAPFSDATNIAITRVTPPKK